MTHLALPAEGFTLAAPAKCVYHGVKRSADFLGALLLLIIGLPLLAVIAVLIRLDSPGPIFFRQERMGSRSRRVDGQRLWELQPFVFLKFRTMVADADSSLHRDHVEAFVNGALQPKSESKAGFKLEGDPRVTRIGRTLRRASLDELPQLLNVLRGDMSLVGPRPVPLYEVSHYGARERARFAALPGITGLWQVSGRCDVPFKEMIELDLEYVRNQSIGLDARILLRTIPAVMGGRGAG